MTGLIILGAYVGLFIGAWAIVSAVQRRMAPHQDFTSLKTVTFGDESAVESNRWASILSIVVIFLIWGAFTGSRFAPIHVPGNVGVISRSGYRSPGGTERSAAINGIESAATLERSSTPSSFSSLRSAASSARNPAANSS